jgi:hypothetical protein
VSTDQKFRSNGRVEIETLIRVIIMLTYLSDAPRVQKNVRLVRPYVDLVLFPRSFSVSLQYSINTLMCVTFYFDFDWLIKADLFKAYQHQMSFARCLR